MRVFVLLATMVCLSASFAAATVSAGVTGSDPTQRWQVFVPYGDEVLSEAVFSPSGSMGCTMLQDPNTNSVLYCFAVATGAKTFSFKIGYMPVRTPLITVTEELVVVSMPTSIRAFNATTGAAAWTNQNEARVAVVDTSAASAPGSAGNGDVAFVGYSSGTLYGIAKNGTTLWTFNGQFGQCSYFPTPIYNHNGTFLACARTLVGGFPAIFAFDVPTGGMLWFDYNQGNDPNPRWADGNRLLFLKANESEWVTAYMVDVRNGFPLWSWPTNMQHATGSVVNGSIAVIGTWASTTALRVADGSQLWSLVDPVDVTSQLSVPIVCGANKDELALFHLQLSENLVQSLRRVNVQTGAVMWNSTMDVNGAQPWHYAAASNRLVTRTPNHVYAFDFATGAQAWSQAVDESDFVSFSGNTAIETREQQVILSFSIGAGSAGTPL